MQSIPACKGKISFLPWILTGYNWPTENELNDIFIGFLPHSALFEHFSVYWAILLVYFSFHLLIFLIVSVYFLKRRRKGEYGAKWVEKSGRSSGKKN